MDKKQSPSRWRKLAMGLSRRGFVSLGGVAAAAGAIGAGRQAAAAEEGGMGIAHYTPATYENNIYTRMLGVRPILPVFETASNVGNSRVSTEVLRAMAEANEFYVDMNELNHAAGQKIAKILGAEAAMVTASSACSMMLAAAAHLTGTDKDKVLALPDVTWPKREILMQKGHRFHYDRAYRAAGGKIVTVDTKEEMINAINKNTAMIAGMAMVERQVPPPAPVMMCADLIAIGKKAKVPVHIDDAGESPPVSKLTRYLAMGADSVNISGSKGLQGPGSTGILAGRKDIIEAAMLNAAPNDSVGRAAKVGKEEIIAVLVALEQFMKRDWPATIARWTAMARTIHAQLKDIPGLTARLRLDAKGFEDIELSWDQAIIPLNEKEVGDRLKDGSPRVFYMPKIIYAYNGPTLVPELLRSGEELMVAKRLREFFLDAGKRKV